MEQGGPGIRVKETMVYLESTVGLDKEVSEEQKRVDHGRVGF